MKKIFLSVLGFAIIALQTNAQDIVSTSFNEYVKFTSLEANVHDEVEIDMSVVAYGPEISFEKTKHNFGTIPQGVPVKIKFVFENTGNSNLVINNAKAGCGCTTPVYSKEPIAPGKKSVIEVGYDAKAVGSFVKDVNIETNAGSVKLIITGVVEVVASDNNGGVEIKIPTKK